MERLVIAVKRKSRSIAPHWREQIEQIEGLTIIGDRNARAVQVEGPDGIRQSLIALIGEYCHIEPVIYYHKSTDKPQVQDDGLKTQDHEQETQAECNDEQTAQDSPGKFPE